MLDVQPLEILDFSGGITDNYINGPINRAEVMENLLLLRYSSNPLIAKPITRPGCELYSSEYPLATGGSNVRIEDLKRFSDFDLCFFSNKVSWLDSTPTTGGWTNLVGPDVGNDLFSSSTTTSSTLCRSEWNDHLFVTSDAFEKPVKIYEDQSGNLQLRTAGLPAPASSPTVAATGHTGKSFLYRFTLEYTYTVKTVEYKDIGGFVEVSLSNADAPEVNKNTITSIPVLTNPSNDTNYDVSNIKVGIYRTTDGGVVFYKVGEVTNGTTTYDDTTADITLVTHEPMYTEGGVVENEEPPRAKVVHVLQDIAYYAHIKDGTEIHKNEVRQSVPGDLDAVPSDFSAFVQDEIIAVSSAKNIPLLICKNSVYRIEGQYDELGNGGMIPIKISDTSTCICSKSVVQTLEGVVWWGEDHIYACDGYQVTKTNKHWPKRYQLFVETDAQRRRVSGKYDRYNRRIWWTAQADSAANDCDTCVVLELDYGISEESTFHFQTGDDSFSPSALEFIGNQFLRGHRLGYVFVHDESIYNDLKVDVLVTPTDWLKIPINYNWTSVAFNCGTNYIRKFAPRLILTCDNLTNLSLAITSINDDGRKIEELKPIRFRGNIDWGDEETVWGDDSIPWSFDGLILEQRRFPSNSLRFSYKQIRLTNAYIVRANSDLEGTATVDANLGTVTLDDATVIWPNDIIDSYISFSFDDYTLEFRITARSDDTLTFSDPNGLLLSGSYDWVIRGYPVNESLKLLSIVLPYSYLGRTQDFYTANDSGVPST